MSCGNCQCHWKPGAKTCVNCGSSVTVATLAPPPAGQELLRLVKYAGLPFLMTLILLFTAFAISHPPAQPLATHPAPTEPRGL